METMLYRSPLPYPTVTVEAPDVREAALLLPAFGGQNGETTSILNYMYQHYLVEAGQSADLAKTIQKIAISEMHHHALLGSLIARLGGTPYLGDQEGYWSGAYLNYQKNPAYFLQNNILAEKKAIAYYRYIVKYSRNPEIQALIERIILDEKEHIKSFEELLTTL